MIQDLIVYCQHIAGITSLISARQMLLLVKPYLVTFSIVSLLTVVLEHLTVLLEHFDLVEFKLSWN